MTTMLSFFNETSGAVKRYHPHVKWLVEHSSVATLVAIWRVCEYSSSKAEMVAVRMATIHEVTLSWESREMLVFEDATIIKDASSRKVVDVARHHHHPCEEEVDW